MIERILQAVRSIIRAELAPVSLAGLWEYEIVAATTDTIDCTPTDQSGRVPPLTKIPMLPSVLGATVTPAVGKLCYVQFVNQDPARFFVTAIDGVPIAATIDATTVVKLGLGAIPVARGGDFAGPFPIIPTQTKVLA